MNVNRLLKRTLPALIGIALAMPTVLADTIRLKDGTVIRGQVIGFRDQQFVVLVGGGARGRMSRMMLYMEDVDSIEFDSAQNAADVTSGSTAAPPTAPPAQPTRTASTAPQPVASSTPTRAGSAANNWIRLNVKVSADNRANGWTNSGLVVRRGQLLRITATGQVSLGNNVFSSPAGIPTLPDRDKLMRDEPTGALIAVIGDDNDDFIFIGRQREFRAQRDGVLFLGVNEGNLNDNSGFFDVVVEAEVPPAAAR
ncbi:MAG: hypothetical protein C4334_11610 [Pyrinomonas sp.]|uniref:LecA/PA-IL family lectin n=1 Tax=Pyrinomonas sp. TaxID=2080306 RepID=UPI00332F4741